MFNVLTGKRWSIISKEMKDYICGYYGKAPGRMDKEIVAKATSGAEILDPSDRSRLFVTTTYDEVGRRDRGSGQERGRCAHVRLVPQ